MILFSSFIILAVFIDRVASRTAACLTFRGRLAAVQDAAQHRAARPSSKVG